MIKTAMFLTDRLQHEDGGFSWDWRPPVSVACRTGDMVRLLVKSSLQNSSTERALEWIMRHQRHDGGWLHCPIGGYCDFMNGHCSTEAVKVYPEKMIRLWEAVFLQQHPALVPLRLRELPVRPQRGEKIIS